MVGGGWGGGQSRTERGLSFLPGAFVHAQCLSGGRFNTVDFYCVLPVQGSLHWLVGLSVCLKEEGGDLEH